jgi:beta-mannosidase
MNILLLLPCALMLMIFTTPRLFAAGQTPATGTGSQRLDLGGAGWEFRQYGAMAAEPFASWHKATVPGAVHTDLLDNQLIPDPFVRDNEAKLQWIEEAGWEYRRTLTATPEMLGHGHLDLVFEGLDTYADVYLNDQKILTADNMFRGWRVDIKPYLHAGENTLRLVFPPILKKAAERAAQDPWSGRTKVEAKTYLRKAAYEYGWDWGPRFVTSGIWRPVYLEMWNEARIVDLHIRQRDINAKLARVTAEVEIESSVAREVELCVSGNAAVANQTQSFNNNVFMKLMPGINHIDLPFEIENPYLWYPSGYGAQPIYSFSATIYPDEHQKFSIDARTVRTGLRKVELRREKDEWGRSFELRVNGIPIFAKGADVIPFDSFPARVTEAEYRRILGSAKAANMNMIRHWGGGYYETDKFYEIADEMGIMIWQDFMFGNDWQPGAYEWKLSVAAEAEDQLKRLRDHPSIVLWCGNNETEGAMGWAGRPGFPAAERVHMWGDYVSTFHGVLAQAVARWIPELPYWPSSPSADLEETSDSYRSGDTHNWNVWHGMVPLTDYEKDFPRFMTEYGFQSFPEMSTVEKFTVPEDRTGITTAVMLAHQKNAAGNQKIHEYMLRDYKEPKDFASFLYVSQVLQAEAIKIGAEHLRRNRPRVMGSIFWQLNDCWPVASWSSIDYYGRWKALQYYARRFYNDLLVSPHVEGGKLNVYIVSDKTEPVTGELRLRVMSQNGTVVSETKSPVEVKPLASAIYAAIPTISSEENFAVAELAVGGKVVSRNLAFFAPTKKVKLTAVRLNPQLSGGNGVYQLKLQASGLARDVYIATPGIDSEAADNYFDLLPGEERTVELRSAAALAELQKSLTVISLADAF